VIGLYDQQGVLRFAGRDVAECLDYAELFGLRPDIYTLQPLVADEASPATIGTLV
jgi:hypothetical protein